MSISRELPTDNFKESEYTYPTFEGVDSGNSIELNSCSERDILVRAASTEDLDALVRIELGAYADVYGENPSEHLLSTVRSKYEERINLLGDWIRVLEHPDDGVYGMIVVCPTDLSKEELIEKDMTSNEAINESYKVDGENVFVVNLAILPNGYKANRLDLFADGITLAIERGVKHAYFESRLPGMLNWISNKGYDNVDSLTDTELDDLAEEYWKETTVVDGIERPTDGLLNMYVEFGCKPLALRKNAWMQDMPSKAYGVLCEFDVPNLGETEISNSGNNDNTNDEEYNNSDNSNEVISKEGIEEGIFNKNKKKLATIMVLGSVAVGIPHVVDNWDSLWQRGAKYGIAYTAFLALYSASGIAKLSSSIKRRIRPNSDIESSINTACEQANKSREDNFLIANGVGAVGMGIAALSATIDLLPVQSWPIPATAAVVDIGATVWSRKQLLLTDQKIK